MKKIAVSGGLAFVATFLLLMLWWPSWAFGANVTYVWRLHLPQVPEKHTVTIYRNFVAGAEQVLTPGTQQAISTTIPDSTFNYAEHRIWWYDTTDAPTTFYQTYCRTRISLADSTQMSYVAGYGGNTADTAVVLWYRNQSALAYAEDAAVDVDSLVSTRYVLDTAQTRIISRANFGGQWVQSEIMICPASSQLVDTLVDTVGVDTVTVFTGGIADENGNDTIRIVVRDQANATNVARAAITVYGPSGQAVGSELTGLDGSVLTVLQQGYDYRVVATAVLYNGTDTTLMNVQAGYDTVIVTKIDITANHAYIYGYVKENGSPIRWARVTIDPPAGQNNSCDSSLSLIASKTAQTDANGYFAFEVPYSSCLGDKAYTLTVSKAGRKPLVRQVTVPDSTSYRVYW